MKIWHEFRHDFEFDVAPELPGSGNGIKVVYFPGASSEGGQDGILIRVVPLVAPPWLGCFAFGYKSPSAINLATSCPDPETLCVVASGAGYIVRAENPRNWEKIPILPITDSSAVVNADMLLFADFTKLCAYGPAGLKWVTPRLSSDGLKIVGVRENQVRVQAWDASRDSQLEVAVDLHSGTPIP